MKQRVISGAILVVILIPTLLIGGYFTGIVLALVSLVGSYELLKVFQMEKSIPGIITYIADIIYFGAIIYNIEAAKLEINTAAFSQMSEETANLIRNARLTFTEVNVANYSLLILLLLFIIILITYVITFPKYKALNVMACFFVFVYAGILLSFVYRIRSLESGIYLVWIIFIASWICDTCAYFSGVTLGKHKAFPVLSPKKTWEGCAGGVLGSVLVAVLFGAAFKEPLGAMLKNPILALTITVAVCSIISMFGDLAASAIKRDYGIKDYGTLIPGHGGIMDRFDSVIFVAPVVYYMIILLG